MDEKKPLTTKQKDEILLCAAKHSAIDIIEYLVETKNIELSDSLKENLEERSAQHPTCLDVLQRIEKRDLHVFLSNNLNISDKISKKSKI